MNKKKWISLALASVMLAGVFAGCSKKDDQATNALDYSSYYDEKGFFKGVNAADYVQLPDYKSFTLPEDVTTASEENVQEEIDTIVASWATKEKDADTTRAIKEGDTVNIDYVGTVDGVEFEGGSTGGKGTDVTLGVTQYIDGFLDQLIGHKPGETFDINVTFPDPYEGNKDLSGKPAVFKITVNHSYKTITPTITDALVKEKFEGKYESIAQLKEDIANVLVENQTLNYIIEELMDETEITEYPQAMVKFEQDRQIETLKNQAAQFGITLEDYITMGGFETVEAFLAQQEEYFKNNVKLALIVQALAVENNLSVAVEDIENYFEVNFGSKDYSQQEKFYGKNYITMVVLQDTVIEFLLNTIKA